MSGLVASQYGLMAVLEGRDQKMFIYNQKRTAVLEFPLDCSYVSQITFDRHHNIVIAQVDQSSLFRYNMNGKALPNLKLPEYICGPTGVTCSPEGDLYVSCNDPYTILKQAVGCSDWMTIYSSGHDYDAEDEDGALDPGRYFPGQMSFGSEGDLFVTTLNCINVFAASNSKLKHRIVWNYDMDRDGSDSDSDSHGEWWKVSVLQVMATSLCATVTATSMCSQLIEITCVNLEGRAIIQDNFGSLGRLRWIAVATFLYLTIPRAAFKCTDVHTCMRKYIDFICTIGLHTTYVYMMYTNTSSIGCLCASVLVCR